MKKIISLCVVLAMAISCLGVTALAETTMPDCEMTILEGEDLVLTDKLKPICAGDLTLDFGMNFKALQTPEEVETSPYKDYLCDFEITFSEDVNVIMAGQYDTYSPDWVALWTPAGETVGDLTEFGYKFKKGETVKVMGTFAKALRETGIAGDAFPTDYTYEFVVDYVSDFDCGVKIVDEKDVDITLQLCLYDPENPDVAIPCGNAFVFNHEGHDLPKALVSELTKDEINECPEALDFGMNFKTLDTEKTIAGSPFADYSVDFEVTFSDDATAILAGQYDAWMEDWVVVKGYPFNEYVEGLTDEGYSFKANEPVRIMKLAEKVITRISYEEVVAAVKDFNCGLKVTSDNEELDITLALCMYETDGHGNETGFKYVIDSITFPYVGFVLPEDTEDHDAVVDAVNNATSINEANKETVKEAITKLPADKQEEIKAEVIEAVADEDVTVSSDAGINAEVSKIEGTNDELTITVEPVEHEDENLVAFDIDAFIGTEEVKNETLDAPILVKIPLSQFGEGVTGLSALYHEHNGVVEEIDFIIKDGYVIFTMNKFSEIWGQPIILAAGEATLELVKVTDNVAEGTLKYNVVLQGDTFRTVQNFGAGEFVLDITEGTRADFELSPVAVAGNTTVTVVGDKYVIAVEDTLDNLWTKNEVNSVNNGLVLGTITLTGRTSGTLTLSDIVMNKHTDSVVNGGTDTAEIDVTNDTAVVNFTIPVPVRNLDVEVYLAHAVKNQKAAYQAMNVTVKKGNTVVKEFDLGSDKEAEGVEFDSATNTYKVSCELELNSPYTVEVTGAGYRKASMNVSMTENKTLKFWNNVLATGETNFLAGDIVADDVINLYDMSAVVSYFDQTINNVIQESEYAQYDLNRDGYINSKDVIIVTNGWGK